MLTVNKLIPQARGLAPVLSRRAPTVELDWDVRQKSRFEATDSSGRQVGVFLARGTVVRGGDVLVGEDGSLIVVKAAAQPVLTVRHCPDHGTSFDLLRAAYHLGNRHVALELQPDRLQLEPDHVLADLLRQMHLIVVEAMAPFEPEGGAYSAGGAGHAHGGHAHAAAPATVPATASEHATAHAHGQHHDHDHDHDHDHGHAHEHGREHSHAHAQSTGAETQQAPTVRQHQQHDHGHHELTIRIVAAKPEGAAAHAAPHVHGPGCGHDDSH